MTLTTARTPLYAEAVPSGLTFRIAPERHSMMDILAHRCNSVGPDPATENTLETFSLALANGFGIETDIRRWPNGEFYISHDPANYDERLAADRFWRVLQGHPNATIALNIKETGYEAELLTHLQQCGVAGQVFLFDMELIESEVGYTARKFQSLVPGITLAARVSDRNEPVGRALALPGSIIWLDEFDTLWAGEAEVRTLHSAGRKIYAVSPELHNFPLSSMVARWRQFRDWGIAGICTDYPVRLADFLAKDDL